jgi:hypothetical protein
VAACVSEGARWGHLKSGKPTDERLENANGSTPGPGRRTGQGAAEPRAEPEMHPRRWGRYPGRMRVPGGMTPAPGEGGEPGGTNHPGPWRPRHPITLSACL